MNELLINLAGPLRDWFLALGAGGLVLWTVLKILVIAVPVIVAVAFFLVFDLGVLVLNFYTSFRIAEDAVMINLSGRQRMLSQRTAKSVFQVEEAVRTDQDPKPALAELRQPAGEAEDEPGRDVERPEELLDHPRPGALERSEIADLGACGHRRAASVRNSPAAAASPRATCAAGRW